MSYRRIVSHYYHLINSDKLFAKMVIHNVVYFPSFENEKNMCMYSLSNDEMMTQRLLLLKYTKHVNVDLTEYCDCEAYNPCFQSNKSKNGFSILKYTAMIMLYFS